MPESSTEKLFLSVVEEYKHGESQPTKEQSLEELKKKYESVKGKNEQQITDAVEKGRLYRFAHCTADELINVYDRTLNSTSALERKELERTIEKIISEVSVEFMEEYACDGDDACQKVPIDVYRQRDEIAALCQKNRETTELYEKYKAEIEGLSSFPFPQLSMIQNKCIPEMIEEGILSKDGKTPLKSINDVACFLVKKGQNITTRLLQDLDLRKKNGEPYSDRSYEIALNIANTTKT